MGSYHEFVLLLGLTDVNALVNASLHCLTLFLLLTYVFMAKTAKDSKDGVAKYLFCI